MSDVELEPRDIAEITEKILDMIPDSEVELIYQVRKFHDSLWNKALELRKSAVFWKHFANILNKNIDSFDEEWQKKILQLFNGK